MKSVETCERDWMTGGITIDFTDSIFLFLSLVSFNQLIDKQVQGVCNDTKS